MNNEKSSRFELSFWVWWYLCLLLVLVNCTKSVQKEKNWYSENPLPFFVDHFLSANGSMVQKGLRVCSHHLKNKWRQKVAFKSFFWEVDNLKHSRFFDKESILVYYVLNHLISFGCTYGQACHRSPLNFMTVLTWKSATI